MPCVTFGRPHVQGRHEAPTRTYSCPNGRKQRAMQEIAVDDQVVAIRLDDELRRFGLQITDVRLDVVSTASFFRLIEHLPDPDI